jgi:plasmid stabilization system protein ParE
MPPHRFVIHRNVDDPAPAAGDLESIKNYLEQHSPHFAEVTVRTVYRRIRSLKTSPDRGRPGHRAGTRERALTPQSHLFAALR